MADSKMNTPALDVEAVVIGFDNHDNPITKTVSAITKAEKPSAPVAPIACAPACGARSLHCLHLPELVARSRCVSCAFPAPAEPGQRPR